MLLHFAVLFVELLCRRWLQGQCGCFCRVIVIRLQSLQARVGEFAFSRLQIGAELFLGIQPCDHARYHSSRLYHVAVPVQTKAGNLAFRAATMVGLKGLNNSAL